MYRVTLCIEEMMTLAFLCLTLVLGEPSQVLPMKPVWSLTYTSQGRLLIAPESGKTAIGLDRRQVSEQKGSFSVSGTRCLSPLSPQMSPGCAEREAGSPRAILGCADAGPGLVASSSHFRELRSQWKTERARSFSFSHSFIY